MESITVEVFANVTNSVVLRTPGRRFPGVVIQGDTLHNMYVISRHIHSLARAGSSEELTDLARELSDLIGEKLKVYESTLIANDIELPYSTWNEG